MRSRSSVATLKRLRTSSSFAPVRWGLAGPVHTDAAAFVREPSEGSPFLRRRILDDYERWGRQSLFGEPRDLCKARQLYRAFRLAPSAWRLTRLCVLFLPARSSTCSPTCKILSVGAGSAAPPPERDLHMSDRDQPVEIIERLIHDQPKLSFVSESDVALACSSPVQSVSSRGADSRPLTSGAGTSPSGFSRRGSLAAHRAPPVPYPQTPLSSAALRRAAGASAELSQNGGRPLRHFWI